MPRYLLVLCLTLCSFEAGWAQSSEPPALDHAILTAVYAPDTGPFAGLMRGADLSAYPVFYGAPLVAWGYGALNDGAWEMPYQLTLAYALTTGGVMVAKRLAKRPRPYQRLDAITSRANRYDARMLGHDPNSFPSGHAALAFTIATTASLNYPEWYVVVPSYAWAGSVALSRVWLGVHYPSDVLVGAAVGSGLAWGVYVLRDVLTPGFLQADLSAGPGMQLRLRF